MVVGASGFSEEVIWLARDCGAAVRGVLDDADEKQGTTVSDVPVLGRIDDSSAHEDADFVVAIGTPRVRRSVVERLGPVSFATLVHPGVKMSRSVDIAEGSIVTAGCVLTVDVHIGRHNIVNLNCTVGHNCRFEDYCTLAPIAAVSGNVHLEEGVEVGTGASLRQGIRMGRGSMLGMGGVLISDVEANVVVVGNPAKPLKTLPAWD